MSVTKIRWLPDGVHIRVTVYCGPDWDHLARTGHLVMRPDEWEAFAALIRPNATCVRIESWQGQVGIR